MNILLINSNPVVSRLLALCTRDEHMVLEEVDGVHMIQHERYDVVFIDEGSYTGDVLNLSDIIVIGKKILLSSVDVEIHDFDMTIEKPFLPSQIIAILDTIESSEKKEMIEEDESDSKILSFSPLSNDDLDDISKQVTLDEKEEDHNTSKTQVLDDTEVEKIKKLLEMDEEVGSVSEDILSDEEIASRKVEVIKEQLIAEGLEIVGEEEIVEELTSFKEEGKVKKEKSSKKKNAAKHKEKKSTKKKKKKSIAFTEEELERIEDAVQVAIATLKRKQMKKLLKGKEIEISIQLEGND